MGYATPTFIGVQLGEMIGKLVLQSRQPRSIQPGAVKILDRSMECETLRGVRHALAAAPD